MHLIGRPPRNVIICFFPISKWNLSVMNTNCLIFFGAVYYSCSCSISHGCYSMLLISYITDNLTRTIGFTEHKKYRNESTTSTYSSLHQLKPIHLLSISFSSCVKNMLHKNKWIKIIFLFACVCNE